MPFGARCAAVALALATVPAGLQAQTAKDSVIGTVNEFFQAMKARDTAALARVLRADGVIYALARSGDSVSVQRRATVDWLRGFAAGTDTVVERMWDPTVLVHGPLATVWAPYDIYVNGRFLHCGIDAFTLVRNGGRWVIATASFTMEPTGCAPSPLGPPR